MSEKNVKEFRLQTRAVHTGNGVDGETGAIKRPITMANSYELPYDPSDLNWSSAGKNLYTRNGGSNQQYLQEKCLSCRAAKIAWCLQAVLPLCRDCSLLYSKAVTM